MPDEPADEPAGPRTERTTLLTADGVRLVAEHRVPPRAVATAAIAHPHPQFGGTMHDAVVETLWRTLGAAGVATVRFSFRGAGGSDGSHGGGEPERNDVLAALDHAASLVPDRPLLACGYSFGADVTLTCDHPALVAWIVAAPPLAMFEAARFVPATFVPAGFVPSADRRPAHLFVAAHDQYAPPDAVRDRSGEWPNTTVHVVDLADHFFRGSLDRLATAVESVLPTLI